MTEFFIVCFMLMGVYVAIFFIIPCVLFELVTAIFPSLAEPASEQTTEQPSITDSEWNRMKVVAHMNNGSYWRDHINSSNPDSMTLWGLDEQYIENYRLRHNL